MYFLTFIFQDNSISGASWRSQPTGPESTCQPPHRPLTPWAQENASARVTDVCNSLNLLKSCIKMYSNELCGLSLPMVAHIPSGWLPVKVNLCVDCYVGEAGIIICI